MKIRTLQTLPVRRGAGSGFVNAFRQAGVFEAAAQHIGFRSAQLLLPDDPDEPAVVAAEWESHETIQRWRDDPARTRVLEALAPHLAGEPGATTYGVVLEWPPAAAADDP